MKEIEKTMKNLTKRLSLLNDRVREISGEITTLDFQMEIEKIDARLYRMKRKTLMYELSLIDKKIGEINAEYKIKEMFDELGLTTMNDNRI